MRDAVGRWNETTGDREKEVVGESRLIDQGIEKETEVGEYRVDRLESSLLLSLLLVYLLCRWTRQL